MPASENTYYGVFITLRAIQTPAIFLYLSIFTTDRKFSLATNGEKLSDINAKLTDFINESKGYDETRTLAEYDVWRDSIFKAIWNAVEQLANIPADDGLGDKARIVQTAISAYKGIYSHKLAKETEEIWGLKHDIEKSEKVVKAISALKIETWFNQLFNINESFDQCYSERNDVAIARIAEKGGDTTVSLRKEATEIIASIIRRVNYVAEFDPCDEATAAANALTGIIEKFKIMATSRKSSKKEDPDGAQKA